MKKFGGSNLNSPPNRAPTLHRQNAQRPVQGSVQQIVGTNRRRSFTKKSKKKSNSRSRNKK
jgi:hypothetical protein